MPSYRPPISRDQYHELEAYYFRLVLFTTSVEYREMKSEKQLRIHREINYMSMALDILGKVFSVKNGGEKAVVAWEKEPKDEIKMIFRFSCIKTASKALGCNQSKISAVCKGLREATGGYVFQYEEDYERNQNLKFDPNNNKFEFT